MWFGGGGGGRGLGCGGGGGSDANNIFDILRIFYCSRKIQIPKATV